MKNSNPFSTQAMVRSALKTAGGPLRIRDIRDLIGLSGPDGWARVSRAIHDLLKSGQLERHHVGRYVYVRDIPESDYCRKQRIMQRIMWIRSKRGEPFTSRKIAELAECSLYFAQRYVAWLAGKGVLRKEGRVQTAPTAYAPRYVGDDDWLKNDDWPVMRRRGKMQDIDTALNEMRDLAQRFFAVEKLDRETLTNLKNAAARLGELVGECEKMKHSSSQNTES